jgi:uncharacterized protein
LLILICLTQFTNQIPIHQPVKCNLSVISGNYHIFRPGARHPKVWHLIYMHLNQTQIRVLGSLIEKEITTPENYPLSLNSLINACNQRSSRDPVMDLDEEAVRQALHALEELGLATPYRDARVTKYEHLIRTVLNLRRDETALLCLLLLRGPQTPGELRSRSDRMYSFDDLAAVSATLERLASRPAASEEDPRATGPLVVLLPRQPGAREARYAHLLGDVPAPAEVYAAAPQAAVPVSQLSQLEEQVAALRELVALLETRVEALESKSNSPLSVPEPL